MDTERLVFSLPVPENPTPSNMLDISLQLRQASMLRGLYGPWIILIPSGPVSLLRVLKRPYYRYAGCKSTTRDRIMNVEGVIGVFDSQSLVPEGQLGIAQVLCLERHSSDK